jgi:cell shape-determining protein MreC
MGLFFSSVGQYKSSWYETARNLFQSRNTQRARAEMLAQENRELRLRNGQLSQDSQETKQQLEQTRQLLQQ